MKLHVSIIAVCALGIGAHAIDLGNVIKQGSEIMNSTSSANGSSLQTQGLKKALDIGVNYAVKSLSGNGFMDNSAVKIPLPESIQNIANIATKFGGEKYVNNLVATMNTAAGQAVSKSVPIFAKAITSMSVEDASKLISGGNNSITDYFKTKTSSDLTQMMKPIISKATKENELVSSYKNLVNFYNKNGGTSIGNIGEKAKGLASAFGVKTDKYLPMSDEDLDSYVTRKAMDGAFYMIGKEEAKIRSNPLSYGSDLIQKVFAK